MANSKFSYLVVFALIWVSAISYVQAESTHRLSKRKLCNRSLKILKKSMDSSIITLISQLKERRCSTDRGSAVNHKQRSAILKISDLKQHMERNSKGQQSLSVLIRGAVSEEAIKKTGAIIQSVIPLSSSESIVTALISPSSVAKLADLTNTSAIQIALGDALQLQSNRSISEAAVPYMWGGGPPNFPLGSATGKGVVVGIVDTGLDTSHEDFRTPSGTRIKYFWDQRILGTAPAGYTYGSEYSAQSINSGVYFDVDAANAPHGTNIAGAAVGNGRATGVAGPQSSPTPAPAYTYMGVAPEADIVVVKLLPFPGGGYNENKVLDGVNYVFQKAALMGKPAVVLLSLGKMFGPHDGSDPLDQGITALTGPGKIVVAAAGNYAGKDRHAEWASAPGSLQGTITMNIPTFSPTSTGGEHVLSEAWHNSGAQYSVTVFAPNGEKIGNTTFAHGQEATVFSNSGLVKIENGTRQSSNGSSRIAINLYRGGTTLPIIASGTWRFQFDLTSGNSSPIDMWITDYQLSGIAKPTYVAFKSERKLITSPGTADGVISVGAYSAHRTWTDKNGVNRSHVYAVENEIANFSSPGPRRDGVRVPTVVASGFGVVSARPLNDLVPDSYVMPGSAHSMSAINNGVGTSIAAAQVAGGVALLLQKNPLLTPEQAQDILVSRARKDTYTGSADYNEFYGFGKFNMMPEAPALTVCPDGDIPYEITIKQSNGAAYANALVSLRFSADALAPSGLAWCGGEQAYATGRATATTGPDGKATFYIRAGKCVVLPPEKHIAQVMVDPDGTGPLTEFHYGYVNLVRSPDLLGHRQVDLADVSQLSYYFGNGVYDICADFDGNGSVGIPDAFATTVHIAESHGSNSCSAP